MDPETPITDRSKGGFKTHKPACRCYPCASRRRKEEAVARAAGTGGYLEGLNEVQRTRAEREIAKNADLPPIIATKRSQRDRVMQWLHYRHAEPNLSNKEIAEKLGLKPASLSSLLSRATAQGWLKFEEPASRLEYEVVPRVIDNLVHFLDQKDKTVTIEAAKGTVFKQYGPAQTEAVAQPVLALKIETAEPVSIKAVTGKILGKPKVLEADLLASEDAIPE